MKPFSLGPLRMAIAIVQFYGLLREDLFSSCPLGAAALSALQTILPLHQTVPVASLYSAEGRLPLSD